MKGFHSTVELSARRIWIVSSDGMYLTFYWYSF
jgi:hypothetical protein